jgi:hypothetical protein
LTSSMEDKAFLNKNSRGTRKAKAARREPKPKPEKSERIGTGVRRQESQRRMKVWSRETTISDVA